MLPKYLNLTGSIFDNNTAFHADFKYKDFLIESHICNSLGRIRSSNV